MRVIVELGSPRVEPEHRLPGPGAIAAQRSRIAADRAALRGALRGLRHRVLRELRTIPYVGLEVDHDALRMLDALPGLVTRVYESKSYAPSLAQSAPLIRAPNAWNAGWDGTGQVIAVLDTGVDKNHPFLTGKVVSEACYDTSPNSSCPNGLDTDTGAGAGVACDFAPECFHGTHVAGIAAGNGAIFDGIARGASLAAIRVFSLSLCNGNPCARARDMDIAHGLERVLDLSATLQIAAVNMSLGGDRFFAPCDTESPMMTAVIQNLREAGIATVVSSGNDGYIDSMSFPACISSAISVGSTTDGSGPGGTPADEVSLFSNSASFLSLLAPGQWVTSSVPGGGFSTFEGTSAAAPHVAGAWAIARQANPTASVDDILGGLRNTGRTIFEPGNGLSFPRIAATLLQFSAGTYSVTETAGNAIITVTRSGSMFGPNLVPLTVHYATSAGTAIPGQDYTETSGTLTFNAGEVSKAFAVAITNDAADDGPRTVNLTLTDFGGGALPGARDTAVLTISDNDVAGSIQFSARGFSALENAGSATITVTRSGGSASGVTVHYATSDGTAHAPGDYQTAAGTLTFDPSGPGATTQTFTVPIVDNGAGDGNRTVTLSSALPTVAARWAAGRRPSSRSSTTRSPSSSAGQATASTRGAAPPSP